MQRGEVDRLLRRCGVRVTRARGMVWLSHESAPKVRVGCLALALTGATYVPVMLLALRTLAEEIRCAP